MQTFQTPLIDQNGDGTADARRKRQGEILTIGRGRSAESDPPVIGVSSASPSTLASSTESATLTVSSVDAQNGVNRVWARIAAPSMMYESLSEPVLALPACVLTGSGTGPYSNSYDQFVYNGNYGVFMYVEDRLDFQSLPEYQAVTQTGGERLDNFIVMDVNEDGYTNLADLILVLQILCGIDPTGMAILDRALAAYDVDGDACIGLAEGIHMLMKIIESP